MPARTVAGWVAGAIALVAPVVASTALAESPRVNYMLQCQGCHLADGAGSPGSVPDLRDSIGRFAQLPRGREYLVRVPGSSQSPLGDAELAEVLNWMIRAFGPAEAAERVAPFTGDEVARFRSPPLLEVDALRGELLREIEGTEAP